MQQIFTEGLLGVRTVQGTGGPGQGWSLCSGSWQFQRGHGRKHTIQNADNSGVGTGLMPEAGGVSSVRHWATFVKVHRDHQEACLQRIFPDHTAGSH